MLVATAAPPRANAHTRDSCGWSCGHMQTMLPKMRIMHPTQIQLTRGFTWTCSVAIFVVGLIVPTMR